MIYFLGISKVFAIKYTKYLAFTKEEKYNLGWKALFTKQNTDKYQFDKSLNKTFQVQCAVKII